MTASVWTTMALSAVTTLTAEKPPQNPLSVRLISEVTHAAPGNTFHVGLLLDHPAGYHSYWKHPGVVGVPTSVKWSLPPGFTAGEIQWPAPEKVMMAIYAAQGYHGRTLLIIPITPPADAPAATSVTLQAEVSWMCCGKACSPAHDVPFSTTILMSDAPRPDPATTPTFDQFRALIPAPSPAWSAAATRDASTITLTLTPADPATPTALRPEDLRFFTADGQIDTDSPQEIEILPTGAIRFTMAPWKFAPENPATLPGVVRATGDAPFTIAVDPAY